MRSRARCNAPSRIRATHRRRSEARQSGEAGTSVLAYKNGRPAKRSPVEFLSDHLVAFAFLPVNFEKNIASLHLPPFLIAIAISLAQSILP